MSALKSIRIMRIIFIMTIFSLTSACIIQESLGSEESLDATNSSIKTLLYSNSSPRSSMQMGTHYSENEEYLNKGDKNLIGYNFNYSNRSNTDTASATYFPSDLLDHEGRSQNTNLSSNMSLSGSINAILNADPIKSGLLYEYTRIHWQKCLGGSAFDRGSSIIQTKDGEYIVAGTVGSNDNDVQGGGFHGAFDFWIAKLDNAGSIKWQKCFGGSGSDTAYSIQQTNDAGYILAGDTNSNDGDITGGLHGGYDIWITKLSSSGVIEWQRCLGGSSNDTARSVRQTNDGGYIIAGWTYSNDSDVAAGGYHGRADSWVVKLNNRGVIQWQKCLGGSDDDTAESISTTNDGGFIVTGVTYSNDNDVKGKHNPSMRNSDLWVVKLNNAGIIQWQKCLGGSGNDWAYSIQQTSNGGYIIGGKTNSNDGDVRGNHGGFDLWVVKLNSVGSIEWQKSLGGSRTDEAYSIQQTDDGGYVIAGDTYSDDGDVNGSHVAPNYIFPDFWVVKIDDKGIIEWQKALGGSRADIAHSIEQTNDGTYIVAGLSQSNDGDVIGNHGLGDVWVVKLTTSSSVSVRKGKYGWTGSTIVGSTNWMKNDDSSIYVDVDTSLAGFTDTPLYFATLGGDYRQWEVDGINAIYYPTAQGFRIYLRNELDNYLTPDNANERGWYIQWTGVPRTEKNAGSTVRGATDWKQYSSNSIYIDIDTTKAEFIDTPLYFTSIGGDYRQWEVDGTNAIYSPTRTGFRIYLRDELSNYLTPELANQMGWKVQWIGVQKVDNQAGSTAYKTTNWKQYGINSIYVDVATNTGLTYTPMYFTSIAGDYRQWEVDGIKAIYSPTPAGFTIYLRDELSDYLTPELANQMGWRLQWAAN